MLSSPRKIRLDRHKIKVFGASLLVIGGMAGGGLYNGKAALNPTSDEIASNQRLYREISSLITAQRKSEHDKTSAVVSLSSEAFKLIEPCLAGSEKTSAIAIVNGEMGTVAKPDSSSYLSCVEKVADNYAAPWNLNKLMTQTGIGALFGLIGSVMTLGLLSSLPRPRFRRSVVNVPSAKEPT